MFLEIKVKNYINLLPTGTFMKKNIISACSGIIKYDITFFGGIPPPFSHFPILFLQFSPPLTLLVRRDIIFESSLTPTNYFLLKMTINAMHYLFPKILNQVDWPDQQKEKVQKHTFKPSDFYYNASCGYMPSIFSISIPDRFHLDISENVFLKTPQYTF